MSEQDKKNGSAEEVLAAGPAGSHESPDPDDAWKRRFDEAGDKAAASGNGGCACSDLPNPEKEGQIPLPKVDFSTFLLSLASSALVHLGEVPNPESGKNEANLQLAKHTIDIVCMLQDKINNGLDAEEARLLEGILYELRMKYVLKVS